jgi:hypothetical protein
MPCCTVATLHTNRSLPYPRTESPARPAEKTLPICTLVIRCKLVCISALLRFHRPIPSDLHRTFTMQSMTPEYRSLPCASTASHRQRSKRTNACRCSCADRGHGVVVQAAEKVRATA